MDDLIQKVIEKRKERDELWSQVKAALLAAVSAAAMGSHDSVQVFIGRAVDLIRKEVDDVRTTGLMS